MRIRTLVIWEYDGVKHPSGGVLDVPDDIGAGQIRAGLAEEVIQSTAVVETATVEAPENRAATKPRARKAAAPRKRAS